MKASRDCQVNDPIETTNARANGIVAAADGNEGIITDTGHRVAKTVLVWELEVIRDVNSHCTFCPMIAGTSREVWGKYLAGGPPAHFM